MIWRLPGRISRHNRPSSLGPGPFAMEATSINLFKTVEFFADTLFLLGIWIFLVITIVS